MAAFVDNYFFYCLGVLAVPAAALGIAGKLRWQYGLFTSAIFILLIYGAPGGGIIYFIAFVAWNYAVTAIYSRLGDRQKPAVFGAFVALALIPLALAKSIGAFRFVGISYMTFRAIQYVVDIKKEKIDRVALAELTYFICFFPALSSGPIDRRRRFAADMRALRTRGEYFELLRDGIWKFAVGALYSFAIAPALDAFALAPLVPEGGLFPTIGYAYAYTLYLFFNFAGYSSLVVGASYIFGIKTPDNFNMPFLSRDLKEFWTRWHISLSSFFRDFIYGEFVAGRLKKRTFKNPRMASYIGLVLTMLVMGAWHGYELRFIAYGAYHGMLLCANEWLDVRSKWFKRMKKHTFGSAICAFSTFNTVVFGMLIFSGKLF